jgi:hypothetical protein
VGGASAGDRRVTLSSSRLRRKQVRYREILREIRSHLTRNGMYTVVRTLRRAAPGYLERDAIRKTREDARAIAKSAGKLAALLDRATLSPEMQLRLEPEKERLFEGLHRLQNLCVLADQNQPDGDLLLEWCARIAFTLLFRFSDKTPTSGSAQSPYRVVASLLYEVVTDQQGHDLKRACDKHLKRMRVAAG